jgi:hypothetical protein
MKMYRGDDWRSRVRGCVRRRRRRVRRCMR